MQRTGEYFVNANAVQHYLRSLRWIVQASSVEDFLKSNGADEAPQGAIVASFNVSW